MLQLQQEAGGSIKPSQTKVGPTGADAAEAEKLRSWSFKERED